MEKRIWSKILQFYFMVALLVVLLFEHWMCPSFTKFIHPKSDFSFPQTRTSKRSRWSVIRAEHSWSLLRQQRSCRRQIDETGQGNAGSRTARRSVDHNPLCRRINWRSVKIRRRSSLRNRSEEPLLSGLFPKPLVRSVICSPIIQVGWQSWLCVWVSRLSYVILKQETYFSLWNVIACEVLS